MDYFAVLAGTIVIVAMVLALASYIIYHNSQEIKSSRREAAILREKQYVENQLRVARRMTVIGALAGGMNYHLSATLFSIRALMDLLEGELQNKTKVRYFSKMIVEEITRGLRVTEDLTQLAHPQQMALRPLSVADLVASAANAFRSYLPKSIRFETNMLSEDVMMMGDETLLRQALHNLLVNAVDAMPDGGKLTLGVSKDTPSIAGDRLSADAGESNGRAVIHVSDTGAGMDDETRSRVFEPFFSTKMRADKLGIGLSFVYGIARIHNGNIEIQSEIDKGTTAFLSIPAVEEAGLSEHPPKFGDGTVPLHSLTLEERMQLMKGFVGET